jgi:hypothetical protein
MAKGLDLRFVPEPLLFYRQSKQSMSKLVNRTLGRRKVASIFDEISFGTPHQELASCFEKLQFVTKENALIRLINLNDIDEHIAKFKRVVIYGGGEICTFLRNNLSESSVLKIDCIVDEQFRFDDSKKPYHVGTLEDALSRNSNDLCTVLIASLDFAYEIEQIIQAYNADNRFSPVDYYALTNRLSFPN